MAKFPTIHLGAGKDKSLNRKHPWIFSGAIERTSTSTIETGATVAVHSKEGNFLGWAAFSPQSQIRARIWSFNQAETIDAEFFEKTLAAALGRREQLRQFGQLRSDAYRWCAAEADGLPGVTIDVYRDWVVLQLLSAGAERWRDEIIAAVRSLQPHASIYERSDVDVRRKEGLAPVQGLRYQAPQSSPLQAVNIVENGLQLQVDIEQGHKTGYYLDQRDARLASQAYVKDRDVLNAFSYTGGFGLYAAAAGANSVVNVDVSEPALARSEQQLALNGLADAAVTHVQQDVFQLLREYHQHGRKFDVIVLDPPKFVDSKANLMSACRGYKDINRMAALLLKPGGTLLTFSCSGLLSGELFQKVVADAALDAKRPLRLIQHLYQAPDHPVLLSYPESLYLKGLVLQAEG